jgi:hypothetical protein
MKTRRSRYQRGSVFLDRRRNIWYFKWYDGASRRTKPLGTTAEITTKTEAEYRADEYRPKSAADVVDKPITTFEAAA